jgi:hypothetical protein
MRKERPMARSDDIEASMNRDLKRKLESQGFTDIRIRPVKDPKKEVEMLLNNVWATSSLEALQTNLRNLFETTEAEYSPELALSKVWDKIEFIKRSHKNKNIVKAIIPWVVEKYGRTAKIIKPEAGLDDLKKKVLLIKKQADELIKRNSIVLSGLDRVSRLRIEVVLFLREENRKLRIRPLELHNLNDKIKARGSVTFKNCLD